jgi:hypothetical protein
VLRPKNAVARIPHVGARWSKNLAELGLLEPLALYG